MQVRCECNTVLEIPDSHAGRRVRCPTCRRVFLVPEKPPEAAPSTTVSMECSCGRKFRAPRRAAGKTVWCPSCSKELTVPVVPGPPSEEAPPVKYPGQARPATGPKALALKEHVTCPRCKTELLPGLRFCVACGADLRPDLAAEEKHLAERARRRRRVGLLAVGVAAVVVAAVFSVWTLGGAPETPSRPAPPTNRIAMEPPAAAGEVIKAFQDEKGRLPRDLLELEAAGYRLPPLPPGLEYDYDANTGRVMVWRPAGESAPGT